MTKRLLWACCALLLCWTAAACRTATPASSSAPAPLQAVDFPAPLDRAFLRASNPELSDAAFAAKWKEGKEEVVSFFRGFPGGFHADLGRVPAARFPGGEVLCFGDAHPENFGYMLLDGKTVYALNDFDDSGFCPAASDALRYFTVLRLGGSDEWLEELLDLFVKTAKGKVQPPPVDPSHTPDWDAAKQRALARYVEGDRIKLSADPSFSEPLQEEREQISAALRAAPLLSGTKLLDIARYTRVSGGSGGLARYWVLAELPTGRTLLELKRAARPGVELGPHRRTLRMDERLEALQRNFWGQVSSSDYFYVSVLGSRFLVRDRLTKAPLRLDKINHEQLHQVLRAQVGQMGSLDGPGFAAVSEDELKRWLRESSEVVAKRWMAAFKAE